MEKGSIDRNGNNNTVVTICTAYLDSLDPAKTRQNTINLRHKFLTVLVAKWADVRVSELKPWHLTAILEEQRKPRTRMYSSGRTILVRWGTGSEFVFIASVKAAFRWAIDQELITRNPFKTVKPPRSKTRTRERIITPQEHTTILQALRTHQQQPLRQPVVALQDTGARPGELTNATAADWNDQLGAIVYYAEDSRREDEFGTRPARKGRTEPSASLATVLQMVRSLVTGCKRKTEFLFRNKYGKPYTPATLADSFRSVRERLEMPHLVPYAYRHTLATSWLTAGGSVDVLAEILGNSPATIRKYYSHLCQQHSAIRAQLEAFRHQETSSCQ